MRYNIKKATVFVFSKTLKSYERLTMRFNAQTNAAFQSLEVNVCTLDREILVLVDLLADRPVGTRNLPPRSVGTDKTSLGNRLERLTDEVNETELRMFLWFGFRRVGSQLDPRSHRYVPSCETLPELEIPPVVLRGECSPTVPFRYAPYPVPSEVLGWAEKNCTYAGRNSL